MIGNIFKKKEYLGYDEYCSRMTRIEGVGFWRRVNNMNKRFWK